MTIDAGTLREILEKAERAAYLILSVEGADPDNLVVFRRLIAERVLRRLSEAAAAP